MEIVYRALVMFFFLWLITRVVGRTTLGELSTFELLLYVTMGDLIQQAVTQQDYSVTSGILAISVFALLTIGLGWLQRRYRRTRPLVHGVPYVVVENGEPVLETMRMERLSMDDLIGAARQEGFERFADIKFAVMETNGRISFFARSDSNGKSGADDPPPVG
ncbi:DUF421 domain-containing protein [Cryptosporangium phraense]|uniref:DUF421 domain-containing protein n=1 Tax=Cryptosporangium phraense TaxID=2593070 RepID=A0A545AW49_9ACTN|nr:YetF domain-containing protein [Cryptosporangium phraense]TQS45566.1 DUF421 domain-containing protein [Cryptosporangium phraense]